MREEGRVAEDETRRTDPAPAGETRTGEAANDAALAARLERLSSGLRRHRAKRPPEGGLSSRDASAYARAVKIGSEFIAGIVVGAGLGWMIDQGLGTRPWGLIVFLLIGFAAGVLNVMRAEGMVGPVGMRRTGDRKDDENGR
jgi:ATP synthase protein I